MVLSDAIRQLHRSGVSVSEGQIRWAIRIGKVSRPPLDGSLRFDFSAQHLAELAAHFAEKELAQG